MQFITVLPDKLRNDNGDKAFLFDWPFAEVWGVEAELIFFDDLLTCVSSQYAVDLNRVYGIGVRYPLDKPDWRTAPSRATLRAWQTRRPGSEEWLSGERAA
jgi:hypothetical protein